jgi:hypothetical protein
MKRDDCFLVFDGNGDIGASADRPDGLFDCLGVEPVRRQLRPQSSFLPSKSDGF